MSMGFLRSDWQNLMRFIQAKPESLVLPETQVRHLLQRIRDEAHRFALTYHRSLRKMTPIDFADIPGIDRKE